MEVVWKPPVSEYSIPAGFSRWLMRELHEACTSTLLKIEPDQAGSKDGDIARYRSDSTEVICLESWLITCQSLTAARNPIHISPLAIYLYILGL